MAREHAVALVLAMLATSCGDDAPADASSATATAPVAARVTAAPRVTVGPLAACASAACEPFLIAKLPTERGTSLALDGRGFAYVSTFFDDAVYRVPLQRGATPQLLYRSPAANLGAIEVHGDELRWSSNEGGRIYAAPTSGEGPIRILADTLPGIWGFASDADWIHWADFGGSAPGTIWKKPVRGGPSVAVARHPASELVDHVLMRSASEVLYTDQSSRVLRGGGGEQPAEVWLDIEGEVQCSGVAEDDTHIYISDYRDRILRLDKRTRALELVATTTAPADVTVDATHIYWVTYTPVEVWARRK